MEARNSALCVEETEDAVKELRAELARAGSTLLTLEPDPVSLARKAPCPLVVPGRSAVPRTGRGAPHATCRLTEVAR
ncbi:hypothetical protein L0M19_21650 [Streptomyces indiaensis]|uniref:Uncharacterized protein n=1 Tax=Streptomyces indiaensis TaxID=284033 RepID=A0ABN3DAR3_9ACTN|nr:hypothetical protein [Streptomyces indiaensis]